MKKLCSIGAVLLFSASALPAQISIQLEDGTTTDGRAPVPPVKVASAIIPAAYVPVAPSAKLTNADVIRMVQQRTPTDVIIAAIQESQPGYSFIPAQSDALSAAGVPDEVFKAMAARAHDTPIPVNTGRNTFAFADEMPGAQLQDGQPAPASNWWNKTFQVLDMASRFIPQRHYVYIRPARR